MLTSWQGSPTLAWITGNSNNFVSARRKNRDGPTGTLVRIAPPRPPRWSESLHLTGLPGAICTTTLVGSVTSRAVGTASWQAWQRGASRRRYRFFTCTTAHHHRQLKNLRRRRSGGTRIAVSPAKGRAGSGTAASRSRRCEPRRPLRRTGRSGHPGGWPLRVGAARVVGDR